MTEMNDQTSEVHIPIETEGDHSSKEVVKPTTTPGHRRLQTAKAQPSTNFNPPRNKEDIMNLDIEQIWKEMEEIGRSKQAAQDLFQKFQDSYYDKNQPFYYDSEQVSPTKRLISMKNATAKHHVIEYRKGITGRYAI